MGLPWGDWDMTNPRAWHAAGPFGVTEKDTAQNRVLVEGGTVRGLSWARRARQPSGRTCPWTAARPSTAPGYPAVTKRAPDGGDGRTKVRAPFSHEWGL